MDFLQSLQRTAAQSCEFEFHQLPIILFLFFLFE